MTNKPKVLYHGSPHRDLEELEPRELSKRDLSEGPLVFATQSLPLATIFINDKVLNSGFLNQIPYAVILGSAEEFAQIDKGGHVYVLPGDSFYSDPGKGMGHYEWVSRDRVRPTDKIEFASGLDAMLKHGVQVYFMNHKIYTTFSNIRPKDDPRQLMEFLNGLESENQKRGVNVKTF